MPAATITTTTTEPASRRLPWARIRRFSSITGAVVLALWFAVLADDILYRRVFGSMRFWAPWPEAALAGVALMRAFRPRWAGLP